MGTEIPEGAIKQLSEWEVFIFLCIYHVYTFLPCNCSHSSFNSAISLFKFWEIEPSKFIRKHCAVRLKNKTSFFSTSGRFFFS